MNTLRCLRSLSLIAFVLSGCAAQEEDASGGSPYCREAHTCMDFCLCTVADIDACLSACAGSSGGRPAVGGAAGGGGIGGVTSSGGAPAGGSGGIPAGGGTSGSAGGPAGGGTSGSAGGLSCVGQCGNGAPVGTPDNYCFCDSQCSAYGDCCADYSSACGAGGVGGSGSGGAGGAPNDCTGWPAGSPGASVGKTLKQSLSWQGFAEYSSNAATHSVQEFYDCDGSKGINALLFITATATCGICKAEAKNLEAKMAAWEPLGIKVISLIIYPSGVSGAQSWKTTYGLTKSSVFSDKMPPSMAYSSTIGTPLHTIVNPRNMQVVYTQMGGGGTSYAKLEQLAQQNQQ